MKALWILVTLLLAATLHGQVNTYDPTLDSHVTGPQNNGACLITDGSFYPYSADFYSGIQTIPAGTTQLTFNTKVTGADQPGHPFVGLCFFNNGNFVGYATSFTGPATISVPSGANQYSFGYNAVNIGVLYTNIVVETGPTLPVPGPAGPAGPPGPQGPQGPPGAAGKNLVSFLQGKNLGVQGDSISALFNNAWQNVVTSRTGMTLAVQEAVAGRRFDLALQCWGNPAVGQSPGNFNANYIIPSFNIPCSQAVTGIPDGTSFAQSLANVDVEIIELGTDDQFLPIGNLGDATTAGTIYGNVRWVVEAYLTAKPTLRLFLVTPQYNRYTTAAITQQVVNAIVNYGNSMGVPVINMYTLGGVNAVTIGTLTSDGVHPTDFAFSTFYGPVIAQALQQLN